MSRPAINITEAMLNLMAEEPRKVIDLADMLACSPQQIIARLRRLEVARKAERQRVNNHQGFFYLWHVAVPGRILPAINVSPLPKVEVEEDDPIVSTLVQRVVSTWEPINRRNEFDVFLFGPARREAA